MESKWERILKRQAETEAKWAEIKAWAFAHGVGLLHHKTRMFTVIGVSGHTMPVPVEKGHIVFLKYAVLFGPAWYTECIKWLEEHLEPLPKELRQGILDSEDRGG